MLNDAMKQLELMGIYTTDAEPPIFKMIRELEADIKEHKHDINYMRKHGQNQSADNLEKTLKEEETTLKAYKNIAKLAPTHDNDATENGAIEEFGQNHETEVMPLEKNPVLAQDASIEKIPANYRPEFPKAGYLVRYAKGMKAKWFATQQEAEAFMSKIKQEGKDCGPVFTKGTKDAPDQKELQRLNNLHVYEKLKEIVEENMKRYKPDHPEYKRLAGLSKKYDDEIKRYSKDDKFNIYEIKGVGLPNKLIGSIEADTPLQAQMKFVSANPAFKNKNIKATKDSSPDKFGTVMKEFYEGKLKSGSGKTVTDPQQAKAIAYSESKDEEPVYTFGTKDGQFKKIDELQKELNDLESEIFGKEKELQSILKETNHPENKMYNPRKQELHKLKGRLEKMKKQLENLKSGKKTTNDAMIRFYGENIDLTKTNTVRLEEILEELQALHEQGDAQRAIKEELNKRKGSAKDEKTYQNGEHVKVVNRSTGEKIELKVLRDNKDGTLEVKAPTGAVLTIKKAWVVDAAYDPKKYEGTRRHETNIWYLENEVTKWRSRYESAKDQVIAYRKMVSSGQYGKLTTEDLKRAERDLEAARMKLEQSLSMLQRAKGQKDEAPTTLDECMEILKLTGLN